MKIPEHVRKCVAYLGYSTQEKDVLAGTAFFMNVRIEDLRFIYLVTAAHIVENMKRKGIERIDVRMNQKKGGFDWLHCKPEHWHFHPTDPVVDVAVLPWIHSEDDSYGVISVGAAATPETIASEGIGIGDEVNMVGLYTEHAGRGRNIPIVRVGSLAAMPEEPIYTSRGLMGGYLVEIRSIGGISGSPVFVRPTLGFRGETDEKGGVRLGFSSPLWLLGLMHGRWDMKAAAPIEFEIESTATDAAMQKQPLNSGIGVVVPIERILEVINQPALVERRERITAEHSLRYAPTTDEPAN